MNWYKFALTKSDEKYMGIIDGVVHVVQSSFGGKTPEEDYRVRIPISPDFHVEVIHDDDVKYFGEYDSDEEVIYMKRGMDSDSYYQFLAHELTHALQQHHHPEAAFTGEPVENIKAWAEWKEKTRAGADIPEPELDTGWNQRVYEDQEIELHAAAMQSIWFIKKQMVEMKAKGQIFDRQRLDIFAKKAYINYIDTVKRKNMRRPEDTEDAEVKGLPTVKRNMLVKKYARRVMAAVTMAGQEIFGLGGRGA